jgi:hypothetical protein
MRQRLSYLCSLMLILGIAQPLTADAQSRSVAVGDCGAAICIKTGDANWKYAASDYCDSEVCLQDSFESLGSLRWDRMPAGQEDLIVADANPFIGLSDAEYQQLKDFGEDNLAERLQLLATVGVTCEVSGFSLRLNIPGRDIVIVTFGATAASSGGSQEFQVVSIDRTFRDLPGGSMGWWIRLVTYRYPGIVRLSGQPVDFASYETGLYVSRLLLFDTGFEYGTAAEYSSHPDCLAR